MRKLHLLIKPVSGLCNLRCAYCFYLDETHHRERASFGIMPEEILERIVIKAFDYATNACTFSFQGGEPTLIGIEFFKSLIRYVKKYNKKKIAVHYAMQTNGILIDDEWATFFATNHFLIGISLDGPQKNHDMYRVDIDGNGSYSRVKTAIEILRKKNVDLNILTVVTAQAAENIQCIFDFFKNGNLTFLQFIPCLDPMFSERGQQTYSLEPVSLGKFLCNLFDRWYEEITQRNFIYIRYFENLVGMLKGFRPESCGLSGMCAVQYVIEADGGVYPCDFYVLDEYHLGNLNQNSFTDINTTRKKIRFIELSSRPHSDCLQCQYGFLCRGGCRRDRILNADNSIGKNFFCEGYRTFFQYIATRLVWLSQGNIRYKKGFNSNGGMQ